MILNFSIIAAILLLIGVLIFQTIRKLQKEQVYEPPENPYTLDKLIQTTAEIFAQRMVVNIKEMNLSKYEAQQKEAARSETRTALHKAGNGDQEAKEYIISNIRDMMRKKNGVQSYLNVDEDNINKFIHFDAEDTMSARDKFEIIMLIYKKKYDDEGLLHFFKDFDLMRPTKDNDSGEFYYRITEEMIDACYSNIIRQNPLTYADKLYILAKRVFAGWKGFGAADILFDFNIDEVDCGVSGIPKGAFEIKQVEEMIKDDQKGRIQYSYDSIWIMVRGLKIHLAFMGFDSQNELIRVCQNIYKYNASSMISRTKAYIISTMITGSRVVVVRPPAASSWAFFVRKFDSVASLAPNALITDENAFIPLIILKWLMRGYQNSVISGAMGCGKTTLLKSLVRYLPAELAIRVYETAAELNLQYTYPLRNILSLAETESISIQELLTLGMKLNSDVTIIGEMAGGDTVPYYIESGRKGSKMAIGTIHTKTVTALVAHCRDNMPGYASEQAAERAVVDVLHFDIHLEKEKTHRYIERISEIVPLDDIRYPSEIARDNGQELSLEDAYRLDQMEYARRSTDRKLYEERDIVIYQEGKYYFNAYPSERTMVEIKSRLSYEEEQEFMSDLKYISQFTVNKKNAEKGTRAC